MAQEDRYAQEQEDFLRRLRARNGRRPEQPEAQQESVRPELQPPPQDGLNLLIASQNREAPSPSVEGGAPPPDPEGRNVLGSAALETVLPAAAYWGGAALGGPFAPITGPIAGGVAGYLSSLKEAEHHENPAFKKIGPFFGTSRDLDIIRYDDIYNRN